MSALISVDAALELINANLLANGSRSVPVHEALGERLNAPIRAQVTHPPANMSAMDGYAVRLADVIKVGAELQVIGEAPAGHPFSGNVDVGQTVRIFTGSVVPQGADHVIIQENCTREGDSILYHQADSEPRHIRMAGLDFRSGEELVAADTMLTPAHIAIAAASNNAELEVKNRLRVGVVAEWR